METQENEDTASAVQTGSNGKVPLIQKVAYGVGGGSEVIMANLIFVLAMPIYNRELGVSTKLLGLAIGLPRLWDAFTDPLMGNISDNTRTRWGRRNPYILGGALATGLLCIALWIPPLNLGATGLFLYFLAISILYFTAYTVFAVPYVALGYELSPDYDERTQVMSYKIFLMNFVGALFVPCALWLCDQIGDNRVEGVRYVGLMYGGIIAIVGSVPAFLCKPHIAADAGQQKTIGMWSALRYTFTNVPFLLVSGTVFIVLTGFFLSQPMIYYLNLAYVCPNHDAMAAKLSFAGGTAYGTMGFLAVPLINWLGRRFDKRSVLLVSMILVGVGFALSWLYFTPRWPYLQIVFGFLISPAMSAMWVLSGSMVADVCDLDEYKTGLRREAMFGAVYTWAFKVGVAGSMSLGGFLIAWSGFDNEIAIQSQVTTTALRSMFALIPISFMLIAFVLIWLYPLSRTRVSEIQAALQQKRRAAQGFSE